MWPMCRQKEEKSESVLNSSPKSPETWSKLKSNRILSSIASQNCSDNTGSADKVSLNNNENNNSSSYQSSNPSADKAFQAHSDSNSVTKENQEKVSSNISKQQSLTEGIGIASLQHQAMQVAYLQQHQQGSGLKNSSPFEEDSNSRAFQSMTAAMATTGTSPTNGIPNQVQQLLSQQQLQSFIQQQAAISAEQQRQAQKLQELYHHHQQKGLQEIQMQLAKQQQKSGLEESTPSADSVNNNSTPAKTSKDSHQQQLQQQLALHQLVQLQQMQQQHQQQQAAAAALQQQSLVAAMAMAQRRQQSFVSPELTNDFQQLLMKHVNDATLRKDVGSVFPFLDDVVMSQASGATSGDENRENSSRFSSIRSPRDNSPDSSSAHQLFGHGSCKWPGCDAECSDLSDFYSHLNDCHKLNDKTTAQYRVQLQVVEQLEKQLHQERERLEAMRAHLKMDGKFMQNGSDSIDILSISTPQKSLSSAIKTASEVSTAGGISGISLPFGSSSIPRAPSNFSLPSSPSSSSHLPGLPPSLFPSSSVSSSPPLYGSHHQPVARDNMFHSSKRRLSGTLPISTELTQNQEFYRNADVRPPFTYASLIRQAIIEAPDCQMTLNEIYNWFQKKFAYFRRNAPTWKNAVRHNLSLHKCFVRVENVKGAVWTVDESEYQKRRPQKFSGSPSIRGRMEAGPSPNFYSNPMSIAAMQMALGDASFTPSQLANHTQSILAANQLPNYNSFLQNNFGSLTQNLSNEGATGIEQSDSSLSNGRLGSVSPSSSSQNQREKARCENFLSNSGIKLEDKEANEERISPAAQDSTEDKIQKSPKEQVGSARGAFTMLHDHLKD